MEEEYANKQAIIDARSIAISRRELAYKTDDMQLDAAMAESKEVKPLLTYKGYVGSVEYSE